MNYMKGLPMSRKLRNILLILFFVIFTFSFIKVAAIFIDYKKAQNLYGEMQDKYVVENTASDTEDDSKAPSSAVSTDLAPAAPSEDAGAHSSIYGYSAQQAPISVDFDGLLRENADTVGWIYIEGIPSISYPLTQTDNDDYYINHTFDGQESKSGTCFITCRAAADLTSPHTLVFGHNMRDGTMFSDLASFKAADFTCEHPYFWILTPEGDYRYEVFSVFDVNRVSDAFCVFSAFDENYADWLRMTKERSLFPLEADVSAEDRVVTLVTCVPDSYNRTCVVAKLIKGE